MTQTRARTVHSFQDFATNTGMDKDRVTIAAFLLLGDHLAGRPTRTPTEYGNLAATVERMYGHGLAAAALLAAGYLEQPDYTPDPTPAAAR